MPGNAKVVLLIEPRDESRAAHADALRGAGFAVVAVPDCTTGLYALAEVTPHIVVASLDPHTRDECLALCSRLKDDPRTSAIPILLTAETISGDDLRRATGMKILGVAVGRQDEAKITGAVRGVLAVGGEHSSTSQPDRAINGSA